MASGEPEAARGAGLDVTLAIGEDQVRLSGAGVDVSAPHRGVRSGLRNALHDVRRERTRGLPVRGPAARDAEPVGSAGLVSLRRAGALLAESFLQGPVADGLADLVHRAEREHVALRIAIDAPELWGLPWEAIPEPVSGRPLALHPVVSVYRRVEVSAPSRLPGPLRIVVAIASPDSGGGPLLDYEHELRSVLEAMRAARRFQARVEIVPFATTAAIRAALNVQGGVHVLHISAHGLPGRLLLEDEAGAVREVTAGQMLAQAVPLGRMPPVISLAACYTDAEGEAAGASFAAELAAHGACAVVGTQTSVSDRYATLLFSRLYAELAADPDTDVVQALADARRTVQETLLAATEPRNQRLAAMDEWGVVTLLAGRPQVPVIDPTAPPVAAPVVQAPGWGRVAARPTGQFVGRRALQRRLPAVLDDGRHTGLVLHGIGGIGKTTLAAEVLNRTTAADPGWRVAGLYGPVTVDGLLTEVAAVARRELLVRGTVAGPQMSAVQAAGRPDLPWRDRFALLREYVLSDMAILVVLDNFEDNLPPAGADGGPAGRADGAADGGWPIVDAALGDLLATWIADAGRSRLLVTTRHPVAWPPEVRGRIYTQPVGPLSAAETGKLLWSLPNIDAHTTTDDATERVWRLVGGHPRCLEFLDALLGHGAARFDDVTRRLADAVTHRLHTAATSDWLSRDRTLDTAVADTVTLIADDILLSEHLTRLTRTPGAVTALAAVSVYREPVPLQALAFHIGEALPADRIAAEAHARQRAVERIDAFLAGYGLNHHDLPVALTEDGPLPTEARVTLRTLSDLAERDPVPPRQPPADVDDTVRLLAASSLIHDDPDTGELFMHRWTATELHRHWTNTPNGSALVNEAHRAAADYWRWRIDVWPQDATADLHDRMEARHHLIAAGALVEAVEITEDACGQLHQWGAWDREISLIHDTLRWLPADSPRQPNWALQLGLVAQRRGDYPEAEKGYQQALTGFERLGDEAGVAGIHHQLGTLAHARGDYPQAEDRYQQALAIFGRLGDQTGMANGYGQLGLLAQLRGDYQEAERRCRQALATFERIDDQDSMATSYNQLGSLARIRGDYPEAERRHQQALTIREWLGDQNGIAHSHGQLGIIAQLRGDYPQAERHCQEALTIFERLGNRSGMASRYQQLAGIARDRGDHPEAEYRYQQALTIFEQLGNQAAIASSHHQLGILAQERGDDPEAERRGQQALAILERLGNRDGLANVYGQLGVLAHGRDDHPEAENRYQQALAIFEQLGDQVGIADSLSQLGTLRIDTGRPADAVAYHIRAHAIRVAIGASRADNVAQLRRLRTTLGDAAFARTARQHLDEDSYAGLAALLEDVTDEA